MKQRAIPLEQVEIYFHIFILNLCIERPIYICFTFITKHVHFKRCNHRCPHSSTPHLGWHFLFVLLYILNKVRGNNVPVTKTTTTNMVMLGETVIMNHLKKELDEEAALSTAVVVRPLNTLRNVDGEVYSLEFFISCSFSSSLAMSRSGHAWTIVYTIPVISCGGWRQYSVSSTSISSQWTCRNTDKMIVKYW